MTRSDARHDPPGAAAVTERHFDLECGGERVPGLIWTPAFGGAQRPVALMGHGRGSSKQFMQPVARRLASQHGLTVIAIDAPGHGERRQPGDDLTAPPPKPDPGQAAREWRTCIGQLARDDVIDTDRLGYWGFSMGAAIGIALLAAEPRINCAALGLMHTHYYPAILADAARITCPLLFSLHWTDNRVPRHEALELFDAFASPDKRMHAYPGDHTDFPDEEIAAAETFLATRLATHPAT